ncbi:uncharacterized protein LOC116849438 [Odontomachus brunneus]|uniref:uncharacterized protein LOC116849438 n=1 Tax=Odontomachus brunneus TaxID=486640 RepID=UPI0013F2B25D|nr:uncharacterized protein LOC116849438 [Odontomachus brunneus]
MELNRKNGTILRDAIGNIIVNDEGNVTCVSEGGLQFHVPYNDIDLNCETLECRIENDLIYIPLSHSTESTSFTNERNDELNYVQVQEESSFSWDDASTKLFLHLYKETQESLLKRNVRKKKILWKNISDSMKKQGYSVTVTQVENKYKTLERAYKNMITNNKKTGRGRATCPYQTELQELLGHKHNIQPLAVCGRQGLIVRKDASTSEQLTCEMAEENVAPNAQNIDVTSNLNVEDEENIIPPTASTSISTEVNTVNPNHVLLNSNRKNKVNTTSQLLQTYITTMDNLTKEIREEKQARLDLRNEIVTEQKNIRIILENHTQNIEKYLTNLLYYKKEKLALLRDITDAS